MLISKSYKVQNNLNYAWDLPKQTLQPAKESSKEKRKRKSPNIVTTLPTRNVVFLLSLILGSQP